MAKVKKIWNAATSVQYGDFPKVSFYGRKPFLVSDDNHRAALKSLGIFEELPGTYLRYNPPVRIHKSNGEKIYIDPDGVIEYDKDELRIDFQNTVDLEYEDWTKEKQDEIDAKKSPK